MEDSLLPGVDLSGLKGFVPLDTDGSQCIGSSDLNMLQSVSCRDSCQSVATTVVESKNLDTGTIDMKTEFSTPNVTSLGDREPKGEGPLNTVLAMVTNKGTASLVASEDKVEDDIEESDKPAKFGKIIDANELGCCEFCGGPVKRRRFSSALKRFCSKDCSKNSVKKPKKKELEEAIQDSDDVTTATGGEGETSSKITWSDYMETALSKAAPDCCFKHSTVDVPGLKPGMKLEAVDRNNPPSFCVATVIQQVGHRVRIRYDGFGKDSSNDCWCNFQAEELHPIGWCAQNGYPLQPPKGINSTLEDWKTFLTQTLTGALAAPHDLFRKTQEHFQPRVHGFEVGMKIEAVHPLKPSTICPATVTKSLGPYYFAVTPDFQENVPSVTFCCHSDSPGIFPVGWCIRNSVELAVPANYTKKTFSWEKYQALTRAPVAPSQLFRKVKAHKFKVGMKVEAVDLEQPQIIRVATITNVMGRLLQLFFDGQSRFQFVDAESPDIYPIGWCKRTAHVLHSPYGPIPSNALSLAEDDGYLDLPSFLEVMGRRNQVQTQPVAGLLPRKVPVRIERDDKSAGEESDISDDDTGSERFYHNKNQIFFNKSCCFGPLLDRDKVAQLPDATPPGKVSSVIRTGLEMVAKAAFDPEKVIGLMQEGCGVRVVVKHKGKILKKAISRVDSRPKLERYLKRFCRRLICCEFFLSLKPVPTPCPDRCQADDQGNLQGPKGLKAKRSREYFEVKHLGVEKKKRGRKRKSELLLAADTSNIVPRPIVENGLPMSAAAFNSVVQMQKTAITVATTHVQNGTAVSSGLPTVPSNGNNLRFQVPANTPVPRSCNTASNSALFAPQGVVPMGHPSRTPVPINALPGGKPVTKEGVQPHNPSTGGGLNASSSEANSRIVTNVSSQRFATSATSSGTTITFGRAPPNVTISNCTPPPLTKIMSETVSSHTATTPNVTVEHHSQLPIHAVSTIQTASVSVPPPLTSGSGHVLPVSVAAGYRQATSPELVPRQVLSSKPGGVIRHPGVHPNSAAISPPLQVKQSNAPPPPPPLVPNARVGPQSMRPQGMYPPPQTSPVAQPRPGLHSLPPSYNSIGARSSVINHHPQVRNPPPLNSSSGATGAPVHSTMGGDKGTSHPGPTSMTHRPIMPNYQGMSRSVSAGGPPANVTPSLRFTNVRGPFGSGSPGYPPNVRPHPGHPVQVSLGTGQQQSFKVNFTVPPVSGSVQRSLAPNPAVSFADLASVPKAHKAPTPIQPKSSIDHLRALASVSVKEPKIEEEATECQQRLEKDAGDDEGDTEEKTETPRKKNLWWLKKRRRKRSRLTYIKAKYRRKDDEGMPNTSEIVPVEEELEPDLQSKSLLDRPKRGRPPKGVPFRLPKVESFSNSDPDWDETEEGRRVKPVVKKRKGRAKKEFSEVASPKLQSPGFDESSHVPMIPEAPLMREIGSRLVATLPSTSMSPVGRSPPVCQRNVQRFQPGVGSPREKRVTSPKGSGMPKLVRMSSGSESRVHHSVSSARTSPYPSPYPSTSSAPLSPKGRRSMRPKPSCVDVGTNTSLPGCVNGRSPDLPANPVTWTVEQVVRYVRSTDCFNYANIFLDQEIDGQALMLLSRDSLMQFTRMKLGPTLKMCSYIAQLKLRAR